MGTVFLLWVLPVADFRYRGLDVIDDWSFASTVKGATRPSTERYFVVLDDGQRLWAFTQREMRDRIAAEVG